MQFICGELKRLSFKSLDIHVNYIHGQKQVCFIMKFIEFRQLLVLERFKLIRTEQVFFFSSEYKLRYFI